MRTYRVPIEQLRDDVRFLGKLLGDVLVEQVGPDLLSLVERIRAEAIADRDRGTPVEQRLVEEISSLPDEQMSQMVRAFTLYFYLVNAAEEHHRLRALRQRTATHPAAPRPESIEAAIRTLRDDGTPASNIGNFLSRLSIRPVLTAHPSEARRRTVLQHLQCISRLIADLDRRNDRADAITGLLEEITLLWQTDQIRHARPTPMDEVQTGLFIFDQSLFDVVPRIYRDLSHALAEYYPDEQWKVPPFLRYSTWIGGDRDGNPLVTDQVTLSALSLHRATALARYRLDVKSLARFLSSSVHRVGVGASLLDAIAAEAETLGAVGQAILDRNPVEPYRQMLGLIDEKLRRTEVSEGGGYASCDEFRADLDRIHDSLVEHRGQRIADGALQDLRWRVQAFGFHLAELEIREHSARHAEALAEILAATHVCPDYLSLTDAERAQLLAAEIVNPRPLIPSELRFEPSTARVVELFRTIRVAQRRFGHAACHHYIISMTHGVSDVLAVVLLAKEAGLIDVRESHPARSSLQIVPLFEGIDDLRVAANILPDLLP